MLSLQFDHKCTVVDSLREGGGGGFWAIQVSCYLRLEEKSNQGSLNQEK